MATEVVLKSWNRINLDASWPGAYTEMKTVENDSLCFETRMWLTTAQSNFLQGKSVRSKLELETPIYPQGFAGTSLYSRIILVFDCEKEALEFIIKHL
jgi:hypothetical protein